MKNLKEKCFVIQGYNTGDGIGMHLMHAANCPRAYKAWWAHVESEWYCKEDGDPRHLEDRWLYHVVGKYPMDAYHNWKKACEEAGGPYGGGDDWDMAIVDVLCSDESLRWLNVGQETWMECSCCTAADSSWPSDAVVWFAKEWPDYPIPTPRPLCNICTAVIDSGNRCDVCKDAKESE